MTRTIFESTTRSKPGLGSPPRDSRGFSLLELMIVVGILLLIAVVAIPSFLRSRQSAKEAAAVSTLQLINAAENLYFSAGGAFGTRTELIADGLLDDRFSGAKSGYVFEITLSGNLLDYTATATAVAADDGRYDYYTSPDYVLRYTTTVGRAPAGMAGQPVE